MIRPVRGFAGGAGQPIPQAASGPAFITGVSASTSTQAGYFTDQHGNPRLYVFDWMEALQTNGGRWNGSGGGTYQQDFDNYCSQRAAQGLTVFLVELIAGNAGTGGAFANGNTWDNVPPFNTGQDPTSGLNNAYWTRWDYLLGAALRNGLTVLPILDIEYNGGTGLVYNGWTNTQFQAFGAALGTRYKNQPNLIWVCGDDSLPGVFDTSFDSWLTGLASSGDTHMVAALWEPEYTSRYKSDTNTAATWGINHSAYNFCYTYNCGYWIIEYAYGEVANAGATTLLTPAVSNGYHYQGGTAAYSSTFDRAVRQECWWTLASGGRGMLTYDVDVYDWGSGSPAQVTGAWFFANNLHNIVTAFTSWPGWNLLIPDTASALVTAGRGTRATGFAAGGAGGFYEPAFTNDYVAASKTPGGALAVLYLPHSTTVTVNTALLAAGWAASWVDPITCATSSAGGGPTFNSTAKGNNSHGDPDWVLVFQAP